MPQEMSFRRKRLAIKKRMLNGVVRNRNTAARNQPPALRPLPHSEDVFLEYRPFIEPAQEASSALRQSNIPEATVNMQWVQIMLDGWRHNWNSRKRLKANSTGLISNIKARIANAMEHKKDAAV